MSIPNNLNPLGINYFTPLTLTAAEANSTVKLTKVGEPVISRITI